METLQHKHSNPTKDYTLTRLYATLTDAIYDIARIYDIRGRWDDAVRLLETGLALNAEAEGDKRGLAKLKTQLGWILILKREFDAALSTLLEAQKLAEVIQDNNLLANCLLRLGYLYDHKQLFASSGDYEKAMTYYQGALVLAEQANDMRHLAEGLFRVGRLHEIHKHDDVTAAEFYGRALGIATDNGFEETAAGPLTHLAFIDERNGDWDNALAHHRQSLALKEKTGYARNFPLGLMHIGRILAQKGESGQALEYYRMSIAAAEEVGIRRTLPWSLRAIGNLHLNEGCYDEAIEYFKQSIGAAEETGIAGTVIAFDHHNIGLARLHQGRFAEAAAAFEHSNKLLTQASEIRTLGHNYAYLAFAHIGLGQHAEALEDILLHLANMQEVKVDVEHGRSHLAVAIVLDRAKSLDAGAQSTLAEISKRTNLPATPTAYLEAAIESASRADHNETLVPALYEHARCLYRSGNRAAGLEKLQAAKHRATQSNMKGELKRIDQVFRDLGIRLPDPRQQFTRPCPTALSSAEKQLNFPPGEPLCLLPNL